MTRDQLRKERQKLDTQWRNLELFVNVGLCACLVPGVVVLVMVLVAVVWR